MAPPTAHCGTYGLCIVSHNGLQEAQVWVLTAVGVAGAPGAAQDHSLVSLPQCAVQIFILFLKKIPVLTLAPSAPLASDAMSHPQTLCSGYLSLLLFQLKSTLHFCNVMTLKL